MPDDPVVAALLVRRAPLVAVSRSGSAVSISMACMGGKEHDRCRGYVKPSGNPCECPVPECGHGTRRDPANTLLDSRHGRVLTEAMVRNAAAKAGH